MTLYGAGLYGAGVYETPTSTITQDTWPPRVLVTVSGLISYGATVISVYREVAGVRTLLRGADQVLTGGSDVFLRVDAELPFGVPVRWVALLTTPGGVVEVGSAFLTASIEKVAITDAITGAAAQVVILAWADKAYVRQASSFAIGGRTVVVSGPRAQFSAAIDVIIESDSARENFDALLAGTTSGVVQIRQQGGYGGVDCYVAVTGDTEHRHSQDGSDPRRRWTLETLQTDGWAPALETRGYTLEDLADAFPVSLEQLNAAFSTLLDIAQADLSP